MKIALCLFGNVGISTASSARPINTDVLKESNNASTDPCIAYDSIKRNILDKYDTDIFIHSWSVNFKTQLVDLYKPESSKFEKQKIFDVNLSKYGINKGPIEKWDIPKETFVSYKILRDVNSNYRDFLSSLAFRTKSRWYSNCKSIQLKEKYERDNNFSYDFVITTRFDCFFNKFIKIDRYTQKGFYASRRTGRLDEDLAFYDLYFMGDSATMNKFSAIFNYLHDYSIRPPFASRQHVNRFIGKDNVIFALEHQKDYFKVMN